MLPVYKAISFREVISKGGRTKPWVVYVRTPDGIKPYVVKLFETALIDNRDCVTNEVLGNILAPHFGLKTPRAALIDIDSRFVSTLRNLDLIETLDNKDGRIKFGTELLEGNVSNILALNSSEAREAVDISTLFAFDNLIRNADRTRNPTNLLVRSNEVYLIDHELAFDISGSVLNDLIAWQWPDKFCTNHVCFDYLRKSWLNFKMEYFNEFEESLRYFNAEAFTPYFNQLKSEGYSAKNHETIINYLLEMKLNSHNFIKALKGKIS